MITSFIGLGDAWGAVTQANHMKETCIKELGSYLLQVNILKVIEYNYKTKKILKSITQISLKHEW